MAVKVRVPMKEGPLTLTYWDGSVHEYTVSDHVVSAKNDEEAQMLVKYVTDAKLDNEKEQPTTK